jgi:type I restriction enzyme R subunit
VHAALTPAIDRFHDLDADQQDAFRDALNRFVRTYSFLSQVVSFIDVKLEADYLFCRALAVFIRPPADAGLDLGSEVELTHLRNEGISSGSISLDPATHGEVATIYSGAGSQHRPDEEPLSKIIALLNERFGTSWSLQDRVFYDVVADKVAAQPAIQQAAAVNTPENFKIVLTKAFVDQVIAQMATSEDMALKLIDNDDMRDAVVAAYLPLIQGKARVAWQEQCPIGELLGPDKESGSLEYKASLRTRARSGEVYKPLEAATLKTIAAFSNSPNGGTLLLGVADDGTISGLANDYASLHKEGKDVRDLFQLHLMNIVTAAMGGAVAARMSVQFHTIDGAEVCRVQVQPSPVPIKATVAVSVKGQLIKKTAFYVRSGNSTRELSDDEQAKYILGRWPGSPPSTGVV